MAKRLPKIPNPLPSGKQLLGRGITRKIFFSYLLPFVALILAGIFLPIGLATWMDNVKEDYLTRLQIAQQADQLEHDVTDIKNDLSGFSTVPRIPKNAGSRFLIDYTNHFGSLTEQIQEQGDLKLQKQVSEANIAFKSWYQENTKSTVFPRVQKQFIVLTEQTKRKADALKPLIAAFRILRIPLMISIPIVSLLLATLVGRALTLGIARPLQALTDVAKALAEGDLAAGSSVLPEVSPRSDDELGDLERAFYQMARTIIEREAELTHQNQELTTVSRRLEAVLNATNDGLVLLNQEGNFQVVNRRFAFLLGVEPEILLNKSFIQRGPLLLTKFRRRDKAKAFFLEALRSSEQAVEETLETIQPAVRTLRLYTAPVRGRDGELLGRVFACRDITREAEVNRMKTEFVSTVSHELKTPLTAIKGHVDLILDGSMGPLTETQTEFLKMAQSSAGQLTALINDILDVSRIESGRIEMQIEQLDYSPMVKDVIQMLTHEAEKRNITLVPPETYPTKFVQGDPDRVRQVLINLLSNSLKYTPAGGTVTVLLEEENGVIATGICDTGVGKRFGAYL
jgi:PAS domain S-box-containing protein